MPYPKDAMSVITIGSNEAKSHPTTAIVFGKKAAVYDVQVGNPMAKTYEEES